MTDSPQKKKILLSLLPFWTPLIPAMGIAYLKSYLNRHGYPVRIVDLNIDVAFKKIYHRYFDKLKEFIEEEKRVNFYNIGHDVMQNHMTAHIYYEDEREYVDLVKTLIYKNYFLDECRNVEELLSVKNTQLEEHNFGF
ncbi:MAG: hypothetical protein GY765_30300 [bacterium]|nr:hypothetical protein [bacterium]